LLSLAIFHGLLQGEAALAAARAVEHYQIDRWGKVASSRARRALRGFFISDFLI